MKRWGETGAESRAESIRLCSLMAPSGMTSCANPAMAAASNAEIDATRVSGIAGRPSEGIQVTGHQSDS